MRRLNVVVSDEAGKVLDEIKRYNHSKSLDTALDFVLRTYVLKIDK
jgi:hypothetical protein